MASGKPHCSAIVVSIASKIVIDGRIWRRYPLSEVASHTATCEDVSTAKSRLTIKILTA